MTDQPGQNRCHSQKPMPANVMPNTRVLRCGLHEGHIGPHREAETDFEWPRDEPQRTHEGLLAALDRCEHGRHKRDNCWSCPGGQSTGNLYLTPGTRIGTTLYGEPIIAPVHDQRGYREAWIPEGHRFV